MDTNEHQIETDVCPDITKYDVNDSEQKLDDTLELQIQNADTSFRALDRDAFSGMVPITNLFKIFQGEITKSAGKASQPCNPKVSDMVPQWAAHDRNSITIREMPVNLERIIGEKAGIHMFNHSMFHVLFRSAEELAFVGIVNICFIPSIKMMLRIYGAETAQRNVPSSEYTLT